MLVEGNHILRVSLGGGRRAKDKAEREVGAK